MTRIRRPITKALAGLFVAAVCAFSQTTTTSARPGTVNYVEGRAFIDGQEVAQNQVGHLTLDTNQTLKTDQNGKAEVLLTPGVFLRLGNPSEIRMVTPSLTDTRVALTQGEAMVDVAQLFKDNNISILDNGASTRLLKNGLYRFDTNTPSVSVFDGKADVQNNDSHVELKKGKQAILTAGKLKAEKFDRNQHDDLYAWSNLRSEYAAEASYATARNIVVNNYGGWGTGWFWNPWYSSWAFVPSAGYFYDPFGWGFFSPGYLPYAPVYYAPFNRAYVPVNRYRSPVIARGTVRPGIAARPRAFGGFRGAPGMRPMMSRPMGAGPMMHGGGHFGGHR
jgi:hypothetical protein